ncbi:VOC family protein [Mesorhizobium sp. NZP2077]|uniref:VOC family protein n=1 Tax=Mesorhizobium sp. NZP2077 TaxID=2483404 RepID=UPI0015574773|nr:VOC family protein [Mesorhizobium sp. NZP2077]QKC82907.1 VOC family protein [Mesorhizobium sp. NZP2077]QKD16405.1 VOC family protein [Mesorhizobium sp. NZP2077]
MSASETPLSIGRIALTVNDLDVVAAFYEDVIGLAPIGRDGESALLGVNGLPLVELRKDMAAQRRPAEAGLFHTAFLLPSRRDLGLWTRHIRQAGVQLDGASDHLVSEALYLNDPEGNGIEVYVDRPRSDWIRHGDEIEMATLPLDLSDLAKVSGDWASAPDGTVIGHVHMRVGDVETADAFMTGPLGLTRTARLPSAGWYGSGGYHHHLAGNVWHSRGAKQRSPGSTGLAEIELLVQPHTLPVGVIEDPWGTKFTITAAQTLTL